MGIISKEACIIVICLFAIILIYAGYLYIYDKGALKYYLFDLLTYFIASIPLSYALWSFICGKEKRRHTLLGLFAALFVLILGNIESAWDYLDFILFFWPLVATTFFLVIMSRKSKSRKHCLMSTIPLALLIVAIGFCVYRGGLLNFLIIPFWFIQFSCAVIYLTLAFGDYDKVRVRVQRLLIVFCLLQTWLIYDDLYIGYMEIPLFQQILILL